jgi:hypothetical protein
MYIHRQSYPHIIYRNIPYAFKQILQELEVTVNVAPNFGHQQVASEVKEGPLTAKKKEMMVKRLQASKARCRGWQ